MSFAESNDLSELAYNISNLQTGKMIVSSMLSLLYHSELGKSGERNNYTSLVR